MDSCLDAGCGMVYKDTEEGSFVELDAAKQIDYYFMKGINLDAVVANYRFLTGEVPMSLAIFSDIYSLKSDIIVLKRL